MPNGSPPPIRVPARRTPVGSPDQTRTTPPAKIEIAWDGTLGRESDRGLDRRVDRASREAARRAKSAQRGQPPSKAPRPHCRSPIHTTTTGSALHRRHGVNRPDRQPTGRKGLHMHVCQAREQYVRWLLVTRDLSPHTIRAYDSDIAAFERHLGIRALVNQIDRDPLLAFMEEQRAAGLSSTTIRRRASGLRGFCKWLLSCSLLDADPWVGTTVAVGRSRKLPRILGTHDLDRLFLSLRRTAGDDDDASDSNEVLRRPFESTTL